MATVIKNSIFVEKEVVRIEKVEVPTYTLELNQEEMEFIAALVGATSHNLSYSLYDAFNIRYYSNRFKTEGGSDFKIVEKK